MLYEIQVTGISERFSKYNKQCHYLDVAGNKAGRNNDLTNLTTCSANSFLLGDGVCDEITNNERCFFDKGDCCLGTEESLKYCTSCTCTFEGEWNLSLLNKLMSILIDS